MAEKVEELLGLDYAAFSRSVLLAQGEFDRFLRADASERDKVLKGVFGLDRIGFTIYSLPREVKARIDYLRMIAEEIVRPAAALGR